MKAAHSNRTTTVNSRAPEVTPAIRATGAVVLASLSLTGMTVPGLLTLVAVDTITPGPVSGLGCVEGTPGASVVGILVVAPVVVVPTMETRIIIFGSGSWKHCPSTTKSAEHAFKAIPL